LFKEAATSWYSVANRKGYIIELAEASFMKGDALNGKGCVQAGI
jgi:hypothetical protein